MRLGNRKCAGDSGPISLVAKAASRTVFPGRRRAARSTGASTVTRAISFTVSVSCGSVELDPGQTVAEEILALAPAHRLGHDLQRGGMHALAVARLIGVSRSTWRAYATGDA